MMNSSGLFEKSEKPSNVQHLLSVPMSEFQNLSDKVQQLEAQIQKLQIDLQNSEMDKEEYKRLHEQSKQVIKDNETRYESIKNRNQFLQTQLQKSKPVVQPNPPPVVVQSQPQFDPTLTIDINQRVLDEHIQFKSHVEQTSMKMNNLLKHTMETMDRMDEVIQKTNSDFIGLFVKQCIGNVIHRNESAQYEAYITEVSPVVEVDIPMYQQTISHYKDQLGNVENRYSQLVEYHEIELEMMKSQCDQLQLQLVQQQESLEQLRKMELSKQEEQLDNERQSLESRYSKLIECHEVEIKMMKSQYQQLQMQHEQLQVQHQQLQSQHHQLDSQHQQLQSKHQSESIEYLRKLKQTKQEHVSQIQKLKHQNVDLEEEIQNYKIQVQKMQLETWSLYNTNKHLTLRLDLLASDTLSSKSNVMDESEDNGESSETTNLKLKYAESLKSYQALKEQFEQFMNSSKQRLLRYDELLCKCKIERSFYQEYMQHNMLPYLEFMANNQQSDCHAMIQEMIQHIYRDVIVGDQYCMEDDSSKPQQQEEPRL